MKTIIAGSRGISDMSLIERAVAKSGFNITEVISGCARGIDQLAIAWAAEKGIAVRRMPADWATHGRRAGMIRNAEMAKTADALIAIWDGASAGTEAMIHIARRAGLKLYVAVIEAESAQGRLL